MFYSVLANLFIAYFYLLICSGWAYNKNMHKDESMTSFVTGINYKDR